MTTVAELNVVLDADNSRLQSGLRNAQSALGNFASGAAQVLGVGVGLLGGVGAAAANVAIEWESAFADVEKTVDASDEQLAGLSDTLRDMATSGTLGALEDAHMTLAQIAASAGALGVSTDDIDEFTQAVASLAVASDLTADAGADFIARFANITGIDIAEDADNVADTIVTLGNSMAATESEIAGFANRLASLSTFGYSADEILGISSAMASLGLSAELGGTNVLKTVSDITTAAAEGGSALTLFADAAGMTSDEFRELVENNPQQSLMMFLNGLRQMDASEQIATLNELNITSAEQARVLMTMAAGFSTVADGLEIAEVAWEGNGAAMAEAQAKAETVSGQMNILKNSVNDLGIEIGTRALPGINDLVTGLTQIVQGNFGDGLNGVAGGLANIIDSFAGTDLQTGIDSFFGAFDMIDDIGRTAEKNTGDKDFNLFEAFFGNVETSLENWTSSVEANVDAMWANLGAWISEGITGFVDGISNWVAIAFDNVGRTIDGALRGVAIAGLTVLNDIRQSILDATGGTIDIAPQIGVSLANLTVEAEGQAMADELTMALQDQIASGTIDLSGMTLTDGEGVAVPLDQLLYFDSATLAQSVGLEGRQALQQALQMAVAEGDEAALQVLAPLAAELDIPIPALETQIQDAVTAAATGGAFTATVAVAINAIPTVTAGWAGVDNGMGSGRNTTINVTSYGTDPRQLAEQVDRANNDRGR